MLILHIPDCHPTSQIYCLLGQKWLASRSDLTPECIHGTWFSGSPTVTLVKLHLGLEVVGITEKIPQRRASCCFRFPTGSGVRGQASVPVSLINSRWEGVCSQTERKLGSKRYKELQGSHNMWLKISNAQRSEWGRPPWTPSTQSQILLFLSICGCPSEGDPFHIHGGRELNHFRVTGCGMVTDWCMKCVVVCSSLSMMMHQRPLREGEWEL